MRTKAFVAFVFTVLLAAPVTLGQPRSSRSQELAAVMALKEAVTSGRLDEASRMYDQRAVIVGPSSLRAIGDRSGIVEHLKKSSQKRRDVYFYFRQPKALRLDSKSVLVVTNYEQGFQSDGNTVEISGKAMYLVIGEGRKWLVGAEVVVPNLNAGSYGPLGTALSAKRTFGVFPTRELAPPSRRTPPPSLTGDEKDLFAATKRINDGWAAGDVNKLLALYNKNGAFSIGDFGPFYVEGLDEVKAHFIDFYKTSKVKSVETLDPVIRVFGNIGVVAFRFDTQLEVSGQVIHSPGQGVYIFVKSNGRWLMAGCTETSFVFSDIGDPYQ